MSNFLPGRLSITCINGDFFMVNDESDAADMLEAEADTGSTVTQTETLQKPLDVHDFRRLLSDQIVRNWSQWATVAGFIPIPLLDTTVIGGVQVKMIQELCKVYDIPFKEEIVKSALAAVTGSVSTSIVSNVLSGSIAKYVPYVGGVVSLATQPAVAYGSTYAVGALFTKHFESKGTLLDISVDSMKGLYKENYVKASSIFKKGKVESASPLSE